ncbi:MAG TPA: cytochrome c nitrite reductase small subunit [Gemmatimonadales bacterium]|nr:cytochrome c nitrite reductase small subunit [Gemmatimonadales bacterium]
MRLPESVRRYAPSVLLGAALGSGSFTFVYGRGASYLTDDPAACANCHVMKTQYDGWLTGGHHGAAVCNDCHTPRHPLGKYSTKALNGFWHSFYFTTGTFPEPIRITARNRAVTEGACRWCHAGMVAAIAGADHRGEVSCIRCHRTVGHGR